MEREELADTLAETFKERLNAMADSNRGWNKTLQLCLEDIEKVYIVKIVDGEVENLDKKPMEEQDESADATVTTTVDTIDGLLKKEINPMMAMMRGKIKIKGDMGVLTRLASVFT